MKIDSIIHLGYFTAGSMPNGALCIYCGEVRILGLDVKPVIGEKIIARWATSLTGEFAGLRIQILKDEMILLCECKLTEGNTFKRHGKTPLLKI